MTDEAVGGDANGVDRSPDKESAGFRLKFAFWRFLAIAAMVYVVSIAFNVYDVLTRRSSPHRGIWNLLKLIFVDGFLVLVGQIPSLLGPLVGVLVVASFVLLTSPVRYALTKRSYAARLAAARKQDNQDLRESWSDAAIDDEVDIPEYVNRKMGEIASERAARIQLVRQWFKRDPLLTDWVALEVAKRRLTKDLLTTTLVSAGAVIIAGRFFDIFH